MIQKICRHYNKTHRINLASILEGAKHTLEHNKWILTVENELQHNIIEREKKLLTYLRNELKVADLFWEVVIDPSYTNQADSQPYTEEEKFKEMLNKNPALQELQKTFKLRLLYK